MSSKNSGIRNQIPIQKADLDPNAGSGSVPTGENGSAWQGLMCSVMNNEHLAERVPVPGDERVLQPHPRLPPEGCRR